MQVEYVLSNLELCFIVHMIPPFSIYTFRSDIKQTSYKVVKSP